MKYIGDEEVMNDYIGDLLYNRTQHSLGKSTGSLYYVTHIFSYWVCCGKGYKV
jgi:hypothetical protein